MTPSSYPDEGGPGVFSEASKVGLAQVELTGPCPHCGAGRTFVSLDGKTGYCWAGHSFTAKTGAM